MIVAAAADRAWEALAALPPLRDDAGVLVLEEADDETHTAAFRYRGTTITATLAAAGEQTRLELTAPALDAATLEAAAARLAAELAAGAQPALTAAEPGGAGPPPAAEAPRADAPAPAAAPAPGSRRAAWAAVGLAAAGAAALVARRRR